VFFRQEISTYLAQMFTIGILLPGSTLYPSIGMDFLQGVKSCLKYHQYGPVDIQAGIIGYGLKDEEIYAAVEKFLIISNADAVLVYAEDYHAEKLSPLATAAGKLLIITNAGTNYPVPAPSNSNTIFHSINDCLCTFLTGKYAARQEGGHEAIMATSFFDGGYRHTHAMNNAFVTGGGEIMHNFVSRYKKEEFNTDTLAAFIKDNPETKKLLAVFSGDMARFFYENMIGLLNETKLQCYGSPMMFDCTPGDFAEPKPAVLDIAGYTNWIPDLDNEINHIFLQYYKSDSGKEANLFSMQGWENALLLMEYLRHRKEAVTTEAAIELLKSKKINSPRGVISINKKNYVLGPAHFVKATGNFQLHIEESIADTADVWEEMLAQIPEEAFSSWRNTYLCI
jgi:branched-chain amino acid transport system substrate-binding protein